MEKSVSPAPSRGIILFVGKAGSQAVRALRQHASQLTIVIVKEVLSFKDLLGNGRVDAAALA